MKKNLLYLLLFFLCTSVIAQPTITSFTPASGPAGTSVVITGTNFHATHANNTVYFGPVKAAITAGTTTSLTVTVPNGAGYNAISVTSNLLTVSSLKPFIQTFPGGSGQLPAAAFLPEVTVPAAGGRNMEFADMDGDGKIDIMVNHNSNKIILLRNTSTATTISYASTDYPSNTTVTYHAFARDMDGDGIKDIVILESDATVSVYRNTSTPGNLSFAARVNVSPPGGYALTPNSGMMDIDRDGKPDIYCASGGGLRIFRNTTVGTTYSFATPVFVTTGDATLYMTSADFDGDTKPDIAATNFTANHVALLRNTSTPGTVSFSRTDITAGDPQDLVSSDFDGDGKIDLAILIQDGSAEKLGLMRNTSTSGAITFAAIEFPAVDLEAGVNLHVGEVNGDGLPDLLSSINLSNQTTAVLRNTSTPGNFSFERSNQGSLIGWSLSTVDMNLDARPEIVFVDNGVQDIRILQSQVGIPIINSFTPVDGGTGTSVTISGQYLASATQVSFGGTNATSFSAGSNTTLTAVVGSGSGGSVSVVTPYGTSTKSGFNFSNAPVITSFAPEQGLPGTEITIVGSRFIPATTSNSVFFGPVKAEVISATTTQLVVRVPPAATYSALTIITSAGSTVSSAFFKPLANASAITTSSYSLPVEFNTESNPEYVCSGDFDGDGKPDIITVGSGSNTFSAFRNTSTSGAVSFASKVNFVTGSIPVSGAVGDFDSDGKLDVVIANSGSGTVSIFRNISTPGNISFSSKIDVATATNPVRVAIGDLTRDGKPDIVTANFTGSNLVSVLRNTTLGSTITFAPKTDITAGSFPSAVAIGDLDSDGVPDLVVTNLNGNSFQVFRNATAGGVLNLVLDETRTTDPGPLGIALGDYNQNGKIDILVTSQTVAAFANSTTLPGDINLVGSISFASAGGPSQAIFADLDGDARMDLVSAATSANMLKVYYGIAPLSFNTINFPTGASTAPTSLVAADFDLDGFTDIGYVNNTTSKFAVIRYSLSTLSGFTPATAGAGQTVTISGTNLTGATAVTFGNTPASSFTVVNSTTITAVVGTGSSGSVSITTPGGTISQTGFTFISPPVITAFTPQAGGEGKSITISGSNFNNASSVTIGGVAAASFTVASSSTIQAVVGTGATGTISVTTPGGTAVSTGIFTFGLVTAAEPGLEDKDVNVFPNPSLQKHFTVTLPDQYAGRPVNLSVTDMNGKTLTEKRVVYNAQSDILISADFPAGTYVLTIRTTDSTLKRKLIIH